MASKLFNLFPEVPRLKIVDVGASMIDGPAAYAGLRGEARSELVGFEPDPEQYRVLCESGEPDASFHERAIGDGQPGTLKICRAPGMTSLLEPDQQVLSHFHGFASWGEVQERKPIETVRLDDCPEAGGADFIKLDIQGGELAALNGALNLLRGALCVHVEVQFVPFYKNQPLFAEIDQALRSAGYFLHKFLPIHSRVFQPLLVNQDIYAGMSQMLWSDAAYFKCFTDFEDLQDASLLKLAAIANDVYESFDLAALALRHLDGRQKTDRELRYLQSLNAAA